LAIRATVPQVPDQAAEIRFAWNIPTQPGHASNLPVGERRDQLPEPSPKWNRIRINKCNYLCVSSNGSHALQMGTHLQSAGGHTLAQRRNTDFHIWSLVLADNAPDRLPGGIVAVIDHNVQLVLRIVLTEKSMQARFERGIVAADRKDNRSI